MTLSASGTKRDETKKDTKRTCRPSLQKHKKIIDKELINDLSELPRDIILIISKMHPLLIPPFTNKTLRRAVKDYLDGGDRKKRIVEKYGEISTWDVSKVKDMHGFLPVIPRSDRGPGHNAPVEGACAPKHIIYVRIIGHVPLVQ